MRKGNLDTDVSVAFDQLSLENFSSTPHPNHPSYLVEEPSSPPLSNIPETPHFLLLPSLVADLFTSRGLLDKPLLLIWFLLPNLSISFSLLSTLCLLFWLRRRVLSCPSPRNESHCLELSWAISAQAFRALRTLISVHNPSLLFLSEVKISFLSLSLFLYCAKKISFNYFEFSPTSSSAGGLALL